MAVAYVDSTLDTEDNSGPITPAGSDRLLVCAVLPDQIADPNTTGNNFNTSEALTDIAQTHTSGSTGPWIEVWRLIAPSAVTEECLVTGGAGDWAVIAMAVSGADQTTPIPTADIQVSESGGATSLSVNVPNVGADDLVWAFISLNQNMTGYTPDGTQREFAAGAGQSGALLTKTGSGSVSIGGSGWTSGNCSIVAGRIAAAGGGPSLVYVPGQAQRNVRHSGRYM